MGITAKGDEALRVLSLLKAIDEKHMLSAGEYTYLNAVEKLDFSEITPIGTLPDSIEKLTNLKSLNLSYTQINALPVSIGKLRNLQALEFSRTQISTFPESIGNLTNLRTLDCSYTKIIALPETVCSLTKLQTLNLSGTQIRILPEYISKLVSLQEFYLFNTPIRVLPEGIGALINLQDLYLSGSQISTLPECIGNLTNLQMLELADTQIGTLPKCIGRLVNLRVLDCTSTKISVLPEFIGNLTNLHGLFLASTRISTLPDFMGNLTNLQGLDFSNTKVHILPEYIGGFTNLQNLNLSDLRLQQIPRSLFDLGLEFSFDTHPRIGITLSGTTLATQPISLFHQPRKLIAAYYDSLESAASTPTLNNKIYDAKVIFLGDGGVGKTYTIKRLLNGGIKEGEKKDGKPVSYPTELTPGIEITDYPTTCEGRPVELRIWDFGGQEIMHAMHRCFLTDRTCYVVMVSNRFGNRTQRARYWLKTIDSFAQNCPVILAVNLWDTDEGIDGVNGELLEQEFPNVKKIIPYSAKGSDKGHFNRLTEAIAEQASRLDSCGMEFPESWAKIRTALSNKKVKETPYISKADYLALCNNCREADPQICSWLLEWFNDLGVCFSYHTDKESGQELENYQVLDPRWLVNAVYLIINKGNHNGKTERRTTKDGTISLELVHLLLEQGGGTAPGMRYTEQECGYILNVMRKFRLSYPNNEESEFIPALCPDEWTTTPQTEGWDSHVTYEMRYKYLPDSVLHQMMIFCVEHGILKQAWNGGMELSNDFDRYHAVIYLREERSTLQINVFAKDTKEAEKEKPSPSAFLNDLLRELNRINTDLNLQAEDVIVIKKNKQTAHFPVAAVLKAKERNIPTLYAMDDGELEEYQVDEILGTALEPEKVEKEKKKAKEEKRPMSEKNMSGGNTYITNHYYGENNGNQYINSTANYTSEDAKKLLQQVLDHQERVTEQFMDELLKILRESREQPVQKLVAEVDAAPQKKKSRLEVARDLLSDSSNLATVATAVAPKLPTLLALAKVFLPGL